MLAERDLKQLDSFLVKVGKESLFEYYKLGTGAPAEELAQAVRKRREWAQGQQSNPKYRDEALWLIKNNNLVRRVLLEFQADYAAVLNIRVDQKALDTLTLFVKGTLAAGVLTPEGESAILRQGRTLGLPKKRIQACVESLLADSGVSRSASPLPSSPCLTDADPWADDFTELSDFLDHYAVLEIAPEATLEDIEAAHRRRYRWARSLSDKHRSSEIYAQLDAAWRVLKDPDRRAAFDVIYRMRNPPEEDPIFGELIRRPYGALPDGPPQLGPPSKGPPPLPALGTHIAGSLGTTFQPAQPDSEPSHASPDSEITALKLPTDRRISERRGAAPAPPMVKRTVGLGTTRNRRRSPRLALPGRSTLDLSVGRKPSHTTLAVKNAGAGRMRGRVSSNKEWLEISPQHLDADAEEQQIDVIVHPNLMPRNESVGLVTITTEHGDRETVTFRVERRRVSSSEVVMLLVLTLLGVSVLHSLGLLPDLTRLGLDNPGPDTVPARLAITVDPRADAIFVDGRAVGSGDFVAIEGSLPLTRSFNVTVTLAGFQDVTERLRLLPGESRELPLRLELSDTMDWRPGEDNDRVELDEDALRKLLATRASHFEDCLAKARAFGNNRPSSLSVDLYATNIGRFRGLSVTESVNLAKDPLPCLKRQLRTLELPLLEADYGVLQTTFSIAESSSP